MITKAILGTVVAAAVLSAPSTASAGTNCKSTWTKASGKVKTFFVPAGKLVCKKLNTDDPAQAQKCIDDLEKYAADAEQIKEYWNDGEDGSWKVGARGLPVDSTQTGTVSTERQFIGSPVLASKYRVTVKRTGGKAKKDLVVRVCLVDASGNDAGFQEIRLNKSGKKSDTVEFEAAEGLLPLIHLNNQKWGTNGHKYTIRAEASGEPVNVAQAKQTLAKKKTTSKKSPPQPKSPSKLGKLSK